MITVSMCGYDSMHKAPMDIRHSKGFDNYLLLLIKSGCFLESQDRITEISPDTALLFAPHSYIHYFYGKPHFNDDWFHFELHDEDENLLQRLSLPMNQPLPLPHMGALTEYSRLVVAEKLSDHPYKQEVTDSLMHALLYSIANQLNAPSSLNREGRYYGTLNEIRTRLINSPFQMCSAAELAAEAGISVSHFLHLYKEFFGVTYKQDMIDARIRLACYYLRTSDMSIDALALFCGYESGTHFMRQFKQATGMTPSQYRNLHQCEENLFAP